MLVMNWLLAGILLSTILLCAVVGMLLFSFRRTYQEMTQLVSPIDENTPSPLAQFIATFIDALGKSMATQMKVALMGDLSAQSRQLQAAEREAVVANLGAQNPLVASLFGGLGKRGQNKILANPMVQAIINQALTRMAGSVAGGNGQSDHPKFKL